jgi:hypothetical protein
VGGNATPRIFTRCGLADGLFEHPVLKEAHAG